MRTKQKLMAILFSVVLLAGTGSILQAQPGQGAGQGQGYWCKAIPGLTEDQQKQIDELRTDHLKKMTSFRNQIRENRAHYQTLMSEENVDMNAVNKNIDAYTSLRNSMMKESAAHRQSVRNLLTDEQKVYFDNMRHGKGKGMGYGRGPGRHGNRGMRGTGMGYGPGNNPNCPYVKAIGDI